LKATGDLGETAQKFMAKKRQATVFQQPLTVQKVYKTLDRMAQNSVKAKFLRQGL